MDDYEVDHTYKRSKMCRGPHILDDGVTLIVPSEYYNINAKNFWKSRGFRWCGSELVWLRDLGKPLFGQVYSSQQWLSSTRRRYFEFWPEFSSV